MDKLKNISSILKGPTSLTAQISGIAMAPADPILGTKIAFLADKDSNRMNLGVGAYRDENGKPYVFKVVQKIETGFQSKVNGHVTILSIAGILRHRWQP